jgi:RNA polymerase-binding transcription factor DksA
VKEKTAGRPEATPPLLRAAVARLRQRLFYECPISDVLADTVDRAQHLEEEQVRLATLERSAAEQQQREVVQALCKEGRYGHCLDCGAPIPPARLRVCPCAVRCVACQGAFETRVRGGGRTAGPRTWAALFGDAGLADAE